MEKKTKIIATIGPASESIEVIEKMIMDGVNIFRFNLKHNEFEWHKRIIKRSRIVAKRLKKKLGIMIDFQGPEIRLDTKDKNNIEIKPGGVFWVNSKLNKDLRVIKINPEIAIKYIKRGSRIFIDDGNVEGLVKGKDGNGIKIEVEEFSVIKNGKSLNIISEELDLPILSEKDKRILERLDEIDPDYIALSFVRNEKDVLYLKNKLKSIDSAVKVVAKIENRRAIKNIEEIIKVSDGIMIARGDLGIEVPINELAFWQKKIIDLCRLNGKPVIVATQMLQSMVTNNRPTRAEATDVSNAVFDGTDALMLSEETSIGINPVRVVREMSSIAIFAENSMITRNLAIEPKNSTEVLVDAAVKIIQTNRELKIGAVVIFTQSGNTAGIFSRYRNNLPIIAITDNKDTAKGLTISYGVKSYIKNFSKTFFEMPQSIIKILIKSKQISYGDSLLVIHGNNWMETGSTSDISLVSV
jgi:pyruvate kinase